MLQVLWMDEWIEYRRGGMWETVGEFWMNNTLPYKNGENTVSYRFGLLVYACLIQVDSLLRTSLSLFLPPLVLSFMSVMKYVHPGHVSSGQFYWMNCEQVDFSPRPPLHILVRHSGEQYLNPPPQAFVRKNLSNRRLPKGWKWLTVPSSTPTANFTPKGKNTGD